MLLKHPSKNISKIILATKITHSLLIPSVLFPVQTTEFIVLTSEGLVVGLLQSALLPDLMPWRKNASENLLLYYHVDVSRKLLRNVGTYIPNPHGIISQKTGNFIKFIFFPESRMLCLRSMQKLGQVYNSTYFKRSVNFCASPITR
jgi:hypothetical protein